jgi:UDP-N-acetyl-D-glucosamine dehydrogenase
MVRKHERNSTPLLKDLIAERDIRIGVIGLGYIGLPLAIKFSEERFTVTGIDINADVINQLVGGESTVEGISNERVKKAIEIDRRLELVIVNEEPAKSGQLTIDKLLGIQIFIVCVPTPLRAGSGWAPDLGYIIKAEELIRRVCEAEASIERLTEERLVILESTTYPGTTREVFAPLLNDFRDSVLRWYLAYSPERTSPGPDAYNENIPVTPGKERSAFKITRIVGGLDSHSTDIACVLYRNIYDDVRPVTNLETAEMVKLIENTFRFVAIGFSNEISRIAKTFGLNVWEIVEAVKTKDFGLDMCYPGLIGGHCLPIDPHYLGWALRNRRQIANFVDVAEKAHQDMRQDALDLIQRLLNRNDRGFAGSNVLFFGISYKKDIGDIRESAAVDLIKKLHSSNARVAFWDPVRAKHLLKPRPRIEFSDSDCRILSENTLNAMAKGPDGKHYFEPDELKGTWEELRERILGNEFNCIVLASDHQEFKACYAEIISTPGSPPVADLSNCILSWLGALSPVEETDRMRKLLEQKSRYMLLGVD